MKVKQFKSLNDLFAIAEMILFSMCICVESMYISSFKIYKINFINISQTQYWTRISNKMLYMLSISKSCRIELIIYFIVFIIIFKHLIWIFWFIMDSSNYVEFMLKRFLKHLLALVELKLLRFVIYLKLLGIWIFHI